MIQSNELFHWIHIHVYKHLLNHDSNDIISFCRMLCECYVNVFNILQILSFLLPQYSTN